MYLLPFMRLYKPHLVVILFPQAEKTFKTLKLLNWAKRWWIDSPTGETEIQNPSFNKIESKRAEYKQPQIVVYVTDEIYSNDIREFMYKCFGQSYGIYSPISGISQELALLGKMVSGMS